MRLSDRLKFDRMTWIVALGTALGIAGWNGSNFFLGAFIDSSGISSERAGLIEAIALLVMGLTMLAISAFLPRIPFNLAIRASGLLILLAQIASAGVHDFWSLVVIRSLSGIGFGVVFALASAAGSGTPDPDRTYSRAATLQILISIVLSPSLGWGMDHFGQAGVFVAMSVYCGAVWLAMVALPLPARSIASRPQAGVGDGHVPNPALVVGVLAATALFGFATNGLWVFVERIGRDTGMSGSYIGLTLSSAAPLGMLGAASAGLIGTRFGRAVPVGLSLFLTGLVTWMLFNVGTPFAFVACYWLWVAVYWGAYPHVFGLAAAIDAKGRVASMTGSILILSGALGTYGAAYVDHHFGLESFALVAFGLCTLAAVIAALVALRLPRTPKLQPIVEEQIVAAAEATSR